jgi:hypothetical protein
VLIPPSSISLHTSEEKRKCREAEYTALFSKVQQKEFNPKVQEEFTPKIQEEFTTKVQEEFSLQVQQREITFKGSYLSLTRKQILFSFLEFRKLQSFCFHL